MYASCDYTTSYIAWGSRVNGGPGTSSEQLLGMQGPMWEMQVRADLDFLLAALRELPVAPRSQGGRPRPADAPLRDPIRTSGRCHPTRGSSQAVCGFQGPTSIWRQVGCFSIAGKAGLSACSTGLSACSAQYYVHVVALAQSQLGASEAFVHAGWPQ